MLRASSCPVVRPVLTHSVNGHDLDPLVSYRLHPNQVAIGFRLLARNLALGLQIAQAQARPDILREPRAFRASHVDGPGIFSVERHTIRLTSVRPACEDHCHLPWTQRTVHYAA